MSEHKIVYESLAEIVDFISATHKHLDAKSGVYCLKLWRHPDGKRVPIEEMRGVRIKEMMLHDKTTLIIRQTSHGTLFKGSYIHSFDSTLYLPDLAMVNVYDYAAEFWTTMGLDFVYLEQTKEAKTVMLAEWIHDIPRNLRAQWFKDDETEDLLGDVGVGPKITRRNVMGRHLDLTGEDL